MQLRSQDPEFGPNTLCREAMELCLEDWAYTVSYCTTHRGWDLDEDLQNWIPDFLAMVSGHKDMATFHQYAFVSYFLVQMLDSEESGEDLNNTIKAPIDPSKKFNFSCYYSWAHQLAEGFDYDKKSFREAFLANDHIVFYQDALWRIKPEMDSPGFVMPIYGPQGEGEVGVMLDGFGSFDDHEQVLLMNVRAVGFDSGSLEYDQNVGHVSSQAYIHDHDHDKSQDRLSEGALERARPYALLKEALYTAYPEGTRERSLVQLYLWKVFHESILPVYDLRSLVEAPLAKLQEYRPDSSTFGNNARLISTRHDVELVRSLGLDVVPVNTNDTPEIVLSKKSTKDV